MKLLYFDDYKLGVLKGDRVVDVSSVVRDIPHTGPGDLIKLPMGIPHGIFNKSDRTVKGLFWVSPTRRLYDLFWGLHNLADQNPADVVALAAKHEIDFLPPPDAV